MLNLEDAFTSFKHDAVRVEALATYDMPEEAHALAEARQGKRPDMSFLDEWHDHLRSVTSTGRSHRRLRLVSNPPTEYEAFEIQWAYPANSKAGEHIRLLKRDNFPDSRDIWLFDRSIAFELIYDERGGYLDNRILEPDDTARVVGQIDKAWASATDLADFRAER